MIAINLCATLLFVSAAIFIGAAFLDGCTEGQYRKQLFGIAWSVLAVTGPVALLLVLFPQLVKGLHP